MLNILVLKILRSYLKFNLKMEINKIFHKMMTVKNIIKIIKIIKIRDKGKMIMKKRKKKNKI